MELFDAAPNYMWDETVSELRRRVAEYDLDYFYDVAVTDDMRKHLSGADDLPSCSTPICCAPAGKSTCE